MEKKKIYYKYAIGKDALKLLEKEGGDNIYHLVPSGEFFYTPFNGGILETCFNSNRDRVEYVKAHGIEIKPKEILDDVERRYLSNVCRPFMRKVKHITKRCISNDNEYIKVEYVDNTGCHTYIAFPNFRRSTMYKGMEPEKPYTPKDLNLK